MTKAQREVYLVLLTDVIPFGLCTFCKFGESQGCGNGNKCTHSLLAKSAAFEDVVESVGELGDCWGFRPDTPLEEIVDVVGMVLIEGWEGFRTWRREDGRLCVAGSANT